MKKNRIFPIILIVLALTACESTPLLKNEVYPTVSHSTQPVSPIHSRSVYQLLPRHFADVANIRAEASRLGGEVNKGKMTKVQAAQYLDKYRQQLVGRNSVDDSVYDVYLRAAIDSHRNQISPEESRNYVRNALKGWQQRWRYMPVHSKPNNPAFTNFLLEYMGMETLK